MDYFCEKPRFQAEGLDGLGGGNGNGKSMAVAEDGLPMKDRRWHGRLYVNAFTGADFVAWLIREFRDVPTREQATEWGTKLHELHWAGTMARCIDDAVRAWQPGCGFPPREGFGWMNSTRALLCSRWHELTNVC